jgi:pSer/pThr/pTyr-binding forkhead associated (FHA) protein
MGGSDDRRLFSLKGDVMLIGRNDRDRSTAGNPEHDIVLADDYKSVTRISKPHGRITRQGGTWFYEDCGSTGGTTSNEQIVNPGKKVRLQDGDLLELAKGVSGAKLLVTLPLSPGIPGSSPHAP